MNQEQLSQTTLYNLTETYPELISFLVDLGFEKIKSEQIRHGIGKTMTLSTLCHSKGLNVAEVSKKIQNILADTQDTLVVKGILPCPIRLPLLDKLEEFLEKNQFSMNYTLPAASSGLDWLVEESRDPDALADVYLSAGFNLFFDPNAMAKYVKEGKFAALPFQYNETFAHLRDSRDIYTVIGVVPAIFLVNKTLLGDNPPPKSWTDLCSDQYRDSIAVPMKDLDLFNAVLLGIYEKYGEKAVADLGKNMIKNMHPAEMIKNAKDNPSPLISIAPYFFSGMLGEEDELMAIWPEDGAIVSPIFLVCQKESYEKAKPFLDFLTSKELGELLSLRGKFPSTVLGVDNSLQEDQKFLFCGFDFLYKEDIESLLLHLEQVFLGNTN